MFFKFIFLHNPLILFIALIFVCNNPKENTSTYKTIKPTLNIQATQTKAKEAFQFCKSKNFNSDFCILIDMSLHSGLKRFFVWSFTQDTIIHSFLVSHGCCDNSWSKDESKDNPKFSNVVGSHCSSLGKYKIGERGYSNWGVKIKYTLYGLDSTNNNAFKRLIILHSWELVPDEEIYPDGTPEGWGCPAISNKNFMIIDSMLKNSPKPVLMWIYK